MVVEPLTPEEEQLYGALVYDVMPVLIRQPANVVAGVVCGILDGWMTEHDMDSGYLEHIVKEELLGKRE